MEVTKILEIVLLGMFFGVFGQGIRIIIGLKKKDAETTGQVSKTPINRQQMGISILISIAVGTIAGILGTLQIFNPQQGITKEFVFTIILCGYSGTDFIEGILKSLKIEPFGPGKIINNISG